EHRAADRPVTGTRDPEQRVQALAVLLTGQTPRMRERTGGGTGRWDDSGHLAGLLAGSDRPIVRPDVRPSRTGPGQGCRVPSRAGPRKQAVTVLPWGQGRVSHASARASTSSMPRPPTRSVLGPRGAGR